MSTMNGRKLSKFNSNTFQPSFFTPVARMNTEILGGPYTISRNIIRVVKHPQYNPANAGNHDNIAVVTLDTEVLASSVTPVPLGYTSFPKIGIDQLVTVGWGYTGNTVSAYLYHGPLRLIQDSSCRAVFGNVDNAYTICASYTNVVACTFDVGSPILFNGMQIGVVGKNMRCGGSEPIVAVDVRAMASFIRPLLP
ncbi:Uncharacterized protein APZ42_017295 [Daphnia magna]|uniref:Peptidase S1 domain-containing protein n=1 Tax=Daphnia magna TaxID=35525 RepID=A0A164ZSU9_9CRUS|nr:Uncharacterized protein APZ42_017295 [Daphnia magna]